MTDSENQSIVINWKRFKKFYVIWATLKNTFSCLRWTQLCFLGGNYIYDNLLFIANNFNHVYLEICNSYFNVYPQTLKSFVIFLLINMQINFQ